MQGFTLAGESQGAVVVMQVSIPGRETLRPVPVCQGRRHCSSATHTLLCTSGKNETIVKKSSKNNNEAEFVIDNFFCMERDDK